MQRTYSIKTKILVTVISVIVIIAVFIGGISIFEVDKYVQESTSSLIYAICEKEVAQINGMFGDMEKSVSIMQSYALELITDIDDIKDESRREIIVEKSEEMFAEVANHTDGTVAYYLRFAPELSSSVAGLFYSKVTGREDFVRFEPTDISLYDKDDIERVGWYWVPYNEGRPVWMMPYYNLNNSIYTISYVIPMYINNEFIGVMGMDFDYSVLTNKIDDISVYKHGYAHLECDGRITYHKEIESGELSPNLSNEYMQVSEELNNGMKLVISANYEDISAIRYDIAYKIVLVVIFFMIIFLAIMITIIYKLVKPLKELTRAAEKLSEGNYEVDMVRSTTKEIVLLGTAFKDMAYRLKEHDDIQRMLAYRDSLTGLKNTTSFKECVNSFNETLGEKRFGIIIFDINYLKEANDEYGHDVGNKLIEESARIISNVFAKSPVFRIGGDEFAAVLQDEELDEMGSLLEMFELQCKKRYITTADGNNLRIWVASGVAVYDPAKDKSFNDVFKRADADMYVKKRKMKKEV